MERKIRILVAEADPSFVKMIEDSLKESGSLYDLEAVSSGRDCLDKLRRFPSWFIKQVPLREHNPWISGVLAISVLLGGFTLRYVGVYAGQLAKVVA